MAKEKEEPKLKLPEKEDDDRGVALYVRVARGKRAEDAKLRLDVLREFCIRNGISPAYEYYDIASSFSQSPESRRGLYDLMYCIFQNKIKSVYIYCPDNVSPTFYYVIQEICRMFKVKIFSVARDSGLEADRLTIYNDLTLFIEKMMRKYGSRKERD